LQTNSGDPMADKDPSSRHVSLFLPFLSVRAFAFAIYFHSGFELLSVSTLPLSVEQHALFQICPHIQARSETVTLLFFSLKLALLNLCLLKWLSSHSRLSWQSCPFFLHVNAQASGTGATTRYWDCCKPSCSWPGKTTLAAGSNPVGACDANDSLLAD
jgi:hypothetical protein